MRDRPPVIIHFASCTGHGGDALHVMGLVRGQRELGCDARILMSPAVHSKAFMERAAALGIPCEEVAGVPLIEHVSAWKRIIALRQALMAHDPTVVHLHTGGLAIRSAEVIGARLTGAVLRVATVQWPFPWDPGSEQVQAQWRRIAPLLDQVIAPSSVSRDNQLTAGLPGEAVIAIANTVDVERIMAGDGLKIRAEFGIRPDQPLVLFLARMEEQKRPLDALNAFAQIAAEFPSARMLFVGSGDQESECRQRIEDLDLQNRVTVVGYRTDVPDFMRAADVYLLPTTGESFGITLGEAMAAGAAVVTSKIAPLFGEVVPEECGLFAPVGDVAGFASALRTLLGGKDRRAQITRRAAEVARERYSPRAVAQAHLDLYDRLLAEHGRQRLMPVAQRKAA